ncbi:MAG: DUF937 domain-containing protein [Erysipelotrichaceae bacterium]|nr:DUF937 domain-containing protein [Erysipelotrichaceae bacterium]
MNLLQLLLGTLVNNNSVDSVSKKTGVSSKLTSTLLMAAIPVLISYMTKNASSKKGAQSLLGALLQHTDTSTPQQQIEEADEDDGSKIIAHILGNDQTKVVNNLSRETGLTTSQVNKTLSTIAPYLLSSLSTATTTATKQKTTQTKKQTSGVDLSDGIDLTDVMSLLTGTTTSSKQSSNSNLVGNILGSLLSTDTSATTKKTTKKTQQQTGLDLNTLMGLLGGTTNTQQKQSAFDGSDLLNILTALSK